MNKIQLISQLENVKNNYIVGLSAISVLSEPVAADHLKKSHCLHGGYVVDFQHVAKLLEDQDSRNIALKEFTTMLVRGLIKESYEVVLAYAEQTSQKEKLQNQGWYHFFRLIRNCVSHNFHFYFKDRDKEMLPLTWRARTITKDLDGQPLEIAFLGYDGIWEYYVEIEAFVTDQLT